MFTARAQRAALVTALTAVVLAAIPITFTFAQVHIYSSNYMYGAYMPQMYGYGGHVYQPQQQHQLYWCAGGYYAYTPCPQQYYQPTYYPKHHYQYSYPTYNSYNSYMFGSYNYNYSYNGWDGGYWY